LFSVSWSIRKETFSGESIFINKLLYVSLRKKTGGKEPTVLKVIVVLVLIYEF
jgi:hypothetical protein